jgi:hypothetical protein
MSLFQTESAQWLDYTRGTPANQLDDGIGDTLVSSRVEQSTHLSVPIFPIHTLAAIDGDSPQRCRLREI